MLVRLSIAIMVIGGINYFSPFEIRAKIEGVPLSIINKPHIHGAMPILFTPILTRLYDTIPSSSGMVVEGGLRALTLLIPADQDGKNLNDYLSSIAQVEELTGLQFLPELNFDSRDIIGNYVSPIVW